MAAEKQDRCKERGRERERDDANKRRKESPERERGKDDDGGEEEEEVGEEEEEEKEGEAEEEGKEKEKDEGSTMESQFVLHPVGEEGACMCARDGGSKRGVEGIREAGGGQARLAGWCKKRRKRTQKEEKRWDPLKIETHRRWGSEFRAPYIGQSRGGLLGAKMR